MTGPKSCPKCGVPLAADAPEGLCRACLLKLGLEADSFPPTQAEKSARWILPEAAELATKFPGLEILDLIGRGGMGAVYRARQKELDRLVAVKILPPGLADDPSFSDRFSREAKALARLNHPNIVTIHDFGQTDGLYFFVMQYVDGVNLRQLLDAGRIAPREALAIVPQVCDALQFAHDHGIVHRDIKPENILLDRRGHVTVADFGLAKIVGREVSAPPADSQSAPQTTQGTEAGRVVGTPQYMAPEQVEHPTEVDHRADIYSLGVVLYQMLTGELPSKFIEPPSKKVLIDVRLDEVVMRALEHDPQRRYQHASEVKTQVESITSGPPQTIGEMRTQVMTVASGPGSAKMGSRAENSAPRSLKVGTSYVTTPEDLATFDGQLYLYRRKSQIVLDDSQLSFSRGGTTSVIPLTAIRDLSIGHFPRTATGPVRTDLISLTHDEGGQTKRLFFHTVFNPAAFFVMPSRRNQCVAEWFNAIRAAATIATGRTPDNTPADRLGVPPSHPVLVWTIVLGLFSPLGFMMLILFVTVGKRPPPTLFTVLTVFALPLLSVAVLLLAIISNAIVKAIAFRAGVSRGGAGQDSGPPQS